ncbi:MAG: hypothetical protein ITG04_10510 [Proteiniphilum sp.]|nr:hypothetical protein [Proteiniphilum sp.]
MRKTFFILSVIFISLLIIQCNRGDKELHKKLVQIATGLNASTPVMLDQYTRLEEATVTPDNVFRYHYSVVNTNNPDSLLENMSQALVKNMKTAFSTNADLRIFTENNVVIEYIYTDENNNNIRTLRINPEDYK